MLTGLNAYLSPGTPEQMAREALAQTSASFGVSAASVRAASSASSGWR